MSSVADYVGRTIDIVAWPGQKIGTGDVLTPACLALPGAGGQVCTGVVKLVQRWLMEFLTIAGSIYFLPDRGCNFMQQLQSGQLHTTLDIEQAFNLSAAQIKLNLNREDADDSPTDEQLANALLLSVDIAADQLALHVQLSSRQGSSETVILPIAVITTGGPG